MALSLSKSITVCAFFNELFESNNGIFLFTISSLILHFLSAITTGNITFSFDLTFLPSPNLNTVSEGNIQFVLHSQSVSWFSNFDTIFLLQQFLCKLCQLMLIY